MTNVMDQIIINLPQLSITATIFGILIMIVFISPSDILLQVPIVIVIVFYWLLKVRKAKN